ncbi:MAG: 50S ribosomal protein L13 [Methanosarcinales archaeon]
MTVIDADSLILGRLASIVAKRLLNGEEIFVINAENAIVSGSKASTLKEYKEMRDKGSKEKGPYFPRMPDRILKRTVRGMLPYKKHKGRFALKRLKVYIGVPDELKNEKTETIPEADMNRLSSIKYIKLGEISRKLGAKF